MRSALSNSLRYFRMSWFLFPHVIHHHHHIPIPDFDITALFRLLPSLITFDSSFILPPEVFKLIQSGLLPSLGGIPRNGLPQWPPRFP